MTAQGDSQLVTEVPMCYTFGKHRKCSKCRLCFCSLLHQHMEMNNSISCLPENTKRRRLLEHINRHVMCFPNV